MNLIIITVSLDVKKKKYSVIYIVKWHNFLIENFFDLRDPTPATPEGQRMMPGPEQQFPLAGAENEEIELFVHPQR